MIKQRAKTNEHGFTLIEMLIVALLIGILLAIAIPILTKARISANETNARKAMQVLRDAETEYFEQDLDNDGFFDYTSRIGDLGTGGSLRCPSADAGQNTPGCVEEDSLIDDTFENAVLNDGNPAAQAICLDAKAGYCISWTQSLGTDQTTLFGDFGWEASMLSYLKTGRKDFAVYADAVIRCTVNHLAPGDAGVFDANRTSPGCD